MPTVGVDGRITITSTLSGEHGDTIASSTPRKDTCTKPLVCGHGGANCYSAIVCILIKSSLILNHPGRLIQLLTLTVTMPIDRVGAACAC